MGKTDEERDAIAYLVAHNFMEQVMADGFYHADLHAGNVMITDDGGIEWIDFGMMGTMTGSQRVRRVARWRAPVRRSGPYRRCGAGHLRVREHATLPEVTRITDRGREMPLFLQLGTVPTCLYGRGESDVLRPWEVPAD